MRILKMKNKIVWSEEMKKNLNQPQEDNFFSGLEKLSLAASLAEELELTCLAETLTKLTEENVYPKN
jgi:hypothetical protein